MRGLFPSSVVFLSMILLFGVQIETAFAQEKVIVPEFYGIYAVSGGKEMPLKNASEENRLKIVGGLFNSKVGIGALSGIAVTPNSYFLSYGKDFAQGGLKLGKFRFDNSKGIWVLEKNIQMKVGPVKGQPELLRIIPASLLQDGVYALYIGDIGLITDADILQRLAPDMVICDVVVGKMKSDASSNVSASQSQDESASDSEEGSLQDLGRHFGFPARR